MSYTIGEDNLDGLESYWHDDSSNLHWPSVFILPPWLKAWWQVFGAGEEIFLHTVRQDSSIIGIAPLRRKGDIALFVGDTDVCDYLDFIVGRGREADFFKALIDDLIKDGIRQLDLKHVRPDSYTMQNLVPVADSRGYKVVTTPEDVNVEMDLPTDWDDYLASLSTKQRHEIRRKLRRMGEAGNVVYHFIRDTASVTGTMDTFFRMFTESRQDKADFLTQQREAFFRRLASNMAAAGLLRLGVLELDGMPVAQIMSFDYNDCIYLYNSGYDPEYMSLSVGLMSKVLLIKNSVEKGKNRLDFLKGSEIYKYHLGGKEVPLYRCLISLEKVK